MIICHGSDWHGCRAKNEDGIITSIFPDIKEDFDVFIMSGDMLPNGTWGANRKSKELPFEKKFQENWVRLYANDLKKCIHDKPFLFSSGNHDFINPCEILKEYGINAIDLDNKVVEFMGFNFYGFPFIPMMENHWNFERNSNDMRCEVLMMEKRLQDAGKFDSLDILVAHCPLNGILDLTSPQYGSEHAGNSHMNSFLSYQLPKLPALYCCGHIHEQGSKTATLDSFERNFSMLISNAATTYNILELDILQHRD